MHTTETLSSDSFAVALAGEPAALEDLLPGFGDEDRLGVVVRDPCGGVGASVLILAAVTRFYDVQRSRSDDFFIYPDYFLFHVDRRRGDHGMLDVWPDHKEVVVPGEAEALLRAINDRGITRLVVPDGEPGAPDLDRISLASARRRIVTTLAYSPAARVRDGDVTLTGDAATEAYVEDVLAGSRDVPEGEREAIRAARARLFDGGPPRETYRRIELDAALALLAP